jgi:hypothetical protein
MEVDPMYRPQSVDELLEAMGDGGKLGPGYKEEESSLFGKIASSLSLFRGADK